VTNYRKIIHLPIIKWPFSVGLEADWRLGVRQYGHRAYVFLPPLSALIDDNLLRTLARNI